jgi:PAS domain S-box-containing protein
MSPYLFLNTFLIGFFGFAALHYFWLWCLSRREYALIVFAVHCVLCASMGPYLIVMATARTATEYQPGLDGRATIGLLAQISTVWILALVTGMRGRWFPITISVACLAAALINAFVVPINGVVTGLDRMRMWWGEAITVPHRTGWKWWLPLVFALVISVYIFGLIGAARLWIRDRFGSMLAGLAAGVSLVSICLAVAIDLLQVRLPYGGSLPHALFVLLIAVLLSREYRLRGERLAAGATALTMSEERFRNAFDFAAIGMALVAPDGRFLRVNQSLCDMVGYTATELLARDLQSITHPDDLQADLGLVGQLLEGSLPYYHLEKRYLHKEGRIICALLSVSLLRGQHGKPLYFISQIEDITERKNVEKTLHAYNLRLKALSHQILGTQETERRRLARELHDEIGQMLTTVGLRLHQLKTICGTSGEAALNEDIAFVNRAIEEVRELSLNLRPPMLDVLGLEAALRWYAQIQSQRSGVDVRLVGHLNAARLDPDLEIACFRVVQESTTNVLRHAQARHAWIELQQEDTELSVVIRDDGVGFDVAAMHNRAGCGASFGILAMRERIDLLGGRLEIASAPGQGTRVCARFPLNGTGTPTESRP